MAKYAAARLSVRVYIDGKYIPASSVKIKYPVNGIPDCQIHCIPGRELATRLTSLAHSLKGLVYQVPLQVYVTIYDISGDYPLQFASPGTYLLFDGYVSDIQYARDVSSLTIYVEGLHWLYDLAYSSALSDVFHPSTPRDVTFNAFLNSRSGAVGALIAVDTAAYAVTPQLVLSDLWAALRMILMSIASVDRFAFQYFPDRINDSFSRASFRALSRFAVGVPPLTVDTRYIQAEFLAYSILTMLTNSSVEYNPLTYTALAETTLWERLSEVLAPLFQFVIIPYPTYARVVPYTPTLAVPYTTIGPSAIWTLTRVSDVTKPLYGVVMMSNITLPGGSDLGTEPNVNNETVGFGGAFKGGSEGLTIFKYAPPYTSYLSVLPMLTAGVSLALDQRGNAYAYPNPAGSSPMSHNIRVIQESQKTLLDRMAQYYYTLELLKNKRLLLSGPLRFDISPGSIVQLTNIGEFFVDRTSDLHSSVTGFVSSVNFQFRSVPGASIATTLLELAFVRDGEQNMHPSFVVSRHPLYATVFNGYRFI